VVGHQQPHHLLEAEKEDIKLEKPNWVSDVVAAAARAPRKRLF
jgi:hypothetical protein